MRSDLMDGRCVRRENGCLEWQGAVNNGYGHLAVDGVWWGAHRLAYTLSVGPIPDGLHIDHLCRNRLCCEPNHLEAVTQAENNRRALPFRTPRTHCPKGHALDGNEKVLSNGVRLCRPCFQERQRVYERRLASERLAVEGRRHPSAGAPRVPLSERPVHPGWAAKGLTGCALCHTDRGAPKARGLCGACYNYKRDALPA